MLVQMFEGGAGPFLVHFDFSCYHPFYPLFHIKYRLVLTQTSLGLWKPASASMGLCGDDKLRRFKRVNHREIKAGIDLLLFSPSQK